jgi:4-aminobutyrate aminotransferase
MAVGARIIEVIKRDKLLENVTKRGQTLKKGLTEMLGKHGITDVRGLGLMIAVEFDTEKIKDKMLERLFKRNLLTLPAGKKSIRLIPPLVISKEQIEQGLTIMNEVFSRN